MVKIPPLAKWSKTFTVKDTGLFKLSLGKTITFHHFHHTPTKLDLNFFFIVPYVESDDVNYRSTQ